MVETVKSESRDRAATRREQRRSLIIAAAEEQLGEAGLAGTTLASVGDRVGLSKGALYYYVDSRDDLFALVLSDVLGQIRDDTAEQVGPDATAVEELRAFAHCHVYRAVNRSIGALIVSNVDYLAAHDRTAAQLHEHELHVRHIIDRGVAAGELRPVNRVVASTVFFGALNTLCRTYDPDGSLDLTEMVDTALDLMLGGWAADPHTN